jgi:DNA helicase-2/ATP-dependent DNA helicase PcrA
MTDYNQQFEQVLAELNAEQRRAVDKIDGPVLVVAGPGTGKTHILAARVGRILQQTDTPAHSILCLTFTDAAVQAMRKRLLTFIGPEAHRVQIFTFHSFCNMVVQDNLERFGLTDLEPISDLERVELLRQMIDELPVGNPLKRTSGDPYLYEKYLKDLFSHMKSENWSPAYMERAIQTYLDDLPNREEYRYKRRSGEYEKGDLKQAQIDDQQERMDKLRAGVRLYDRFQQLMRQHKRYDYDDMILWVLEGFRKYPGLLRFYQERYLYFLVDEYQDTNGAQNAVLHQLISYWDQPNVFIVGDDDQSIYEFQGARLKNITDFFNRFRSDLEVVVLKENYRSTQNILDDARELIDRNEKRILKLLEELELDKVLVASHPERKKEAVPTRVLEFGDRVQQDAYIVQAIKELQGQGVPSDEIAVLFAQHKQANDLRRLLREEGIPFQARRVFNVLDVPLIRQVRLFLEYLEREFREPYSGEHLLFQLLHAGFWGIPPRWLAKTARREALQEERTPWRDLLSDPAYREGEDADLQDRLAATGELLETLLADWVNLPLPRLLERLLTRARVIDFGLAQDDPAWQTQVLRSFMDFVKGEVERQPRLRAGELLETFDRMDANRIALPLQWAGTQPEGVQLLTAHSAKGLEFAHVFVYDASQSFWEPGKRSGGHRFSYPDTLTFSGEEDAEEAKRRLFYVAATRAKVGLTITYSVRKPNGKEDLRALFVDEWLAGNGQEAERIEMADEVVQTAQLLSLRESEPPQLEHPLPREAVEALLEGMELSITGLNTFLRCPLSFFYRDVLRVPSLQSEAACYGTAMHAALQRQFERMLRHKDRVFPGKEVLVQDFERAWAGYRGYVSPAAYERRLEAGRTYLAQYFDQYADSWGTEVRPEFYVRNVEIEGVPVKGVVDRLELINDLEVKVLDYKTGKASKDKLRGPTKGKPEGTAYWRQLVFYKLLVEGFRRPLYRVKQVGLSYLEPDADGQFPEVWQSVSMEDQAVLKGLIRSAWERIQDHDFYTGCGEDHCEWCQFVENNEHLQDLSDLEAERMDDTQV